MRESSRSSKLIEFEGVDSFILTIVFIRGAPDVTKQAHSLIATLIKDPDVDILQMLPKTNKTAASATTLWDKTQIGVSKRV